jgi:hypothetical protein
MLPKQSRTGNTLRFSDRDRPPVPRQREALLKNSLRAGAWRWVMLRRVQCTYRRVSWLAVVPVAVVLMSCGGSPVGETVSGPTVVAGALPDATAAVDAGVVAEAGKKARKVEKVLLCHKGRDKQVPPSAVGGHLRHGDSLGSCSAPIGCPCFSSDDIQAAASQCSTTVTQTCSVGDPYYLFLGCEAGGSVPPSVLGVYLTQTSDGGYCERNDVFGSFSQAGLTSAEYQACVDEIGASGYCF